MSARDNIKKANMVSLNNNHKVETIVDDIQNNLLNHVEENDPEPPKPKTKKRAPGRPRKFSKDESTVFLGIQVKEEEARFLEKFGGEYGGKTGYVTKLIREEMARVLGK